MSPVQKHYKTHTSTAGAVCANMLMFTRTHSVHTRSQALSQSLKGIAALVPITRALARVPDLLLHTPTRKMHSFNDRHLDVSRYTSWAGGRIHTYTHLAPSRSSRARAACAQRLAVCARLARLARSLAVVALARPASLLRGLSGCERARD